MWKRAVILLLAFIMCAGILSGCARETPSGAETDAPLSDTDSTEPDTDAPKNDTTKANDEKTMDIYLIAGQSNATGYTKLQDMASVTEFSPEAVKGFSNVHYTGNSRSNGAEPRDRVIAWQNTTIGLGYTQNHFGPEVGMAKALSAYYNAESGKNAGIIKYAFGGSSLLNKTEGATHKDGNWVSPSYQKTLPVSEVVENVTGQMYRNFLNQVETGISGLREYGGYTRIRICGLYWMQGCSDRDTPQEYELAFKCFARDVRTDLSAIMKKYTGSDDDCGASEMPIVVGTISQTQNLTSASTEAVNSAFIQMQKSLENKVKNCHVVDNSAYRITAWENNKQVVYGSDRWHWNQSDMLAIGKNVGDALLYYAGIRKK